jgi:hypothetical protein
MTRVGFCGLGGGRLEFCTKVIHFILPNGREIK